MKLFLLCFIVILFSVSCGKSPQSTCVPNFVSSNVEMDVQFVSGSDYKYSFQVCRVSADLQTSEFSVYGVVSESHISSINLQSAVRLGHVEGGIQVGDVFEVDFRASSGDTYFVIYEDNELLLDNSNEILRGNLLSIL